LSPGAAIADSSGRYPNSMIEPTMTGGASKEPDALAATA